MKILLLNSGEPENSEANIPGTYVPLVDREAVYGSVTKLLSPVFSHYGQDYKLTFQFMKLGTGVLKVRRSSRPPQFLLGRSNENDLMTKFG